MTIAIKYRLAMQVGCELMKVSLQGELLSNTNSTESLDRDNLGKLSIIPNKYMFCNNL